LLCGQLLLVLVVPEDQEHQSCEGDYYDDDGAISAKKRPLRLCRVVSPILLFVYH
jgi:hypothetical protein